MVYDVIDGEPLPNEGAFVDVSEPSAEGLLDGQTLMLMEMSGLPAQVESWYLIRMAVTSDSSS